MINMVSTVCTVVVPQTCMPFCTSALSCVAVCTHIAGVKYLYFIQRKGKKKMTLTISKGGIRIVDDTTKVCEDFRYISTCNIVVYHEYALCYAVMK